MKYKADWEESKERFCAWWDYEVIDRPMIQVLSPRENVEVSKEFCDQQAGTRPKYVLAEQYQEGWNDTQGGIPPLNDLLTPEKIIQQFRGWCDQTFFGGDAYPNFFINFGPGILASYFGAIPKVQSATVWFETPMTWDELAIKEFVEENPWWQQTLACTRYVVKECRGDYIPAMTDLGGITDILSSLRNGTQLILDMFRHPHQVLDFSYKILKAWQHCYQTLYDLMYPQVHGSSQWMQVWSPKRWYPIQCDFATMLSPPKFNQFALPFLEEQCVTLDHVIYHLDGPEELPHLETLLQIPGLNGIQWVPGEGNPNSAADEWLPIYRKIQAANKLLILDHFPAQAVPHILQTLSPKGLLIQTVVDSHPKAEELIKNATKFI